MNSPCVRRCHAFSLVEVALAIGILSFCLISIMGLIPVAMRTARQSMDKSTQIRMMQAIQATMLDMPYSDLTNQSAGAFLFDADGFLLPTNAVSEPRYRVIYQNSSFTVLPGNNQNAGRLMTVHLTSSNVVTHETQTNSLHLPDNGY